MTENEALEYLKRAKRQNGMLGILPTSDIGNTIIKALEEVQRYRELGTPEELQTMKEHGSFTGFELAQIAAGQMLLKEYQAIGTLEECREVVKICKDMKDRRFTPRTIEAYMKFEDECINKGFTLDSLIEARWRQTPYKPSKKNLVAGVGKCKCGVEFVYKSTNSFCGNCGQKLDWSE